MDMELITTRICMANDIGLHGNMFGGVLLSAIDEAAAAFAAQAADNPRMVTLKMDEVLFKKPVKQGHLIKIYGEVIDVGNTSLTLRIEARQHNVHNGKQEVVCTTTMIFVRIDEFGDKQLINDRVRERYGFPTLNQRVFTIEPGKLKPEDVPAFIEKVKSEMKKHPSTQA